MRFERPPAVILKYYLYQATATFGFFWPVFTIFLLYRGLSFTEITLLNSFSAALVVVGEIPTGYVSDRIGRRNSLIVSSVLYSVSILGFVFAQTFAGFFALYLLWSFAQTFQSGAGDAWLYDVLKARLDEDRYTHIRGRGGSVNMWVNAGTMLTAGVLYQIDPTVPFVAGGILPALGAIVLFTLPENEQQADDDEETYTVYEAIPVIKRSFSRPPLRSFVAYVALFFAMVLTIDNFIQPIVVDAVGFPESTLGPLYAGFSVVAGVLSYHAGTIEDALTTRWAIVLLPLLTSLALVVPLVVPLAAVPAFFIMKSARTVMSPIASGYINDHTESFGRATVLSAASMAYALVRVPMQPFTGVIADLASPTIAVAALSVVFLVGFVVVHAWEAPATESVEAAAGSTD